MKKVAYLSVAIITLCFSFSAIAQVNPVALGRASNVYSILRTAQNQVYANEQTGLVAFIHRHDVTIWGGGSGENGKFRYDFSTDKGLTFTTDNGVLNSIYLRNGRYPQITGYNILGSTNPLDVLLPWSGSTVLFPTPGWLPSVTGLSTVGTTPTSTENYRSDPNPYRPNGLCQGLPGEFWMAEFGVDGSTTLYDDTLRLYKGTYNGSTSDIDWIIYEKIHPNNNLAFDGVSKMIEPNIAFSPNGTTGWTAMLGDLVGGQDLTHNPIFIKSTDGGVNWGNPVEIDLNAIAYSGDYATLAEELQALWEDSPGIPTGTGLATCTNDFDITVDENGNPHLFVVVANGSTQSNAPSYVAYTDYAKIALDVTSTDGGTTWKAVKIAPIHAFRGDFGFDPSSSTTIPMDNYTQISRTENGSHIFYSWVDSDTNVTGFGTTANLAPNLRIAGMRVSDGYQTCPKWVTHSDPVWDSLALFPTMAPTVLTNSGTEADYNLPIVIAKLLTGNYNEPTQFYYFGNDATLLESDFQDPSTINLDVCFTWPNGLVEHETASILAFPNPTSGVTTMLLSGFTVGTIDIDIYNAMGQLVIKQKSVISNGKIDFDMSSLENGIYTITAVTVEGKKITSRLVKM